MIVGEERLQIGYLIESKATFLSHLLSLIRLLNVELDLDGDKKVKYISRLMLPEVMCIDQLGYLILL